MAILAIILVSEILSCADVPVQGAHVVAPPLRTRGAKIQTRAPVVRVNG